MSGKTIGRYVPASWKRRIPALRERDALRRTVQDLRTRVAELEARPGSAVQPGPSGLHGTYVGDGRMLIAPLWGGRLHVPSTDLSLTPELVAHGTYDVPFTSFVQRHIKPGDVVFDVGANVGLFTLLLGYQVWELGTVVAYEPNPRLLPFLRDNVSMNWFADRVEIVPKAAAARAGTLPFGVPDRFAGCGSLGMTEHPLPSEAAPEALERVEVEAEPLDVHLGRFERIDLVKIDVEGAEAQVFAGMERLLDSGTVRRVTFELIRSRVGNDWESFSARLRALAGRGWSFATLSPSGEPERAALGDLLERPKVSQVLMTASD